ncbi:MAG: hypothetical protein NUW37_16700 [Planctomycetes bacterium]|nr:hypothetical protein [Planctomycetota bacterium]
MQISILVRKNKNTTVLLGFSSNVLFYGIRDRIDGYPAGVVGTFGFRDRAMILASRAGSRILHVRAIGNSPRNRDAGQKESRLRTNTNGE